MNNNFSNILKKEASRTLTENGQITFDTTDSHVLDLFSTIGSLRNGKSLKENNTISNRYRILIDEAYKESPELLMKTIFHVRDIRGGLGERETFRVALNYCANRYPEIIKNNIRYISEYGRFDDLYSLIGTKLEKEMWLFMDKQLTEDIKNMKEGKPISLLAKWIKSIDASSKETKELGKLTAKKLGYYCYDFKRVIRSLRKYIDIVERKMTLREWSKIDYQKVPSKAIFNYNEAFKKHDNERYNKYIEKVKEGKLKINSDIIYPHEFIRKLERYEFTETHEEMWKNLPNYTGNESSIVVADVSGSMDGTPLECSIGLAIYFAERNEGPFKDLFITFSEEPEIQKLRGITLKDKYEQLKKADWGNNTDLRKVFEKILFLAINNNITNLELPKNVIIISDMEIDRGINTNNFFQDEMEEKFRSEGYTLPKIIYWNVASRNDIFHIDKEHKNTILCSGSSINTFKTLIGFIDGITPYQYMLNVLSSERYNYLSLWEEKQECF